MVRRVLDERVGPTVDSEYCHIMKSTYEALEEIGFSVHEWGLVIVPDGDRL